MNKKTIMFVIPTLNKGGAERVISVLANYLSNKFTVSVVSLGTDAPQYDIKAEFVLLNTNVYKSKCLKAFNIFLRALAVRKLIKSRQPDTIISFMESANIPVILASRLVRNKRSLVVSVRNNPSRFPWYYRLAIRLLYSIPDRVVAPSLGISKALETHIIQNHGIDFIPNPIDPSSIRKQASADTNYPFDLPDKYILAVGRLTYQKGFDRLISIFSKLKSDDLHLVILGEGELRNDLLDLVRIYDLGDRVIMPGIVSNPFPIYRNAVCLALTSRYEGWPNVLNEAIASSCPVVSYGCKYGPDEILNCNNGLLIDEGDEQAFIDAVDSLCADQELRIRIIQNGLDNVENFSVEKISSHWLEIAGLN